MTCFWERRSNVSKQLVNIDLSYSIMWVGVITQHDLQNLFIKMYTKYLT